MSSFEEAHTRADQRTTCAETCVKYSIKHFEVAINRGTKILNIDIDRLERHNNNIVKFRGIGEWADLRREQVNATRTLQQLKANLRDLERMRLRVRDEDVVQFDGQVSGVHRMALDKAQNLLTTIEDCRHRDASDQSHTASSDIQVIFDNTREHPANCAIEHPLDGAAVSVQKDSDTYNETAQNWERLGHSVQELNDVIATFSELVHTQQESVDRIEDNIDRTRENVGGGASNLAAASRYKAAMFPVLGAIVGGILAGPIGLYAGAKIGGAAGLVGGSAMGFMSGNYLKKKQQKDIELDEIERKQSDPLVAKKN